jgi:hypothetical protein
MKNSPLKVEMLLWYFHSPVDFPNIDCDACQTAIDDFEKLGIMKRILNQKLKVEVNKEAIDLYVETICNIDLPRQVWVVSSPYL